MSLLTPQHETPIEPEIEALIREARQLRRRRRLRRSLVAVLALALAGGAYGVARGSGPRPTTVLTAAHRPLVNIRAFGHNGDLAFVSRNALWVLDGATGSLREVAADHAIDPTFSPDGKWLAYMTTGPARYDGTVREPPIGLWIAHANGSDAHAVRGLNLQLVETASWSPTADTLAVIEGSFGSPRAGVALVRPNGGARLLPGTSTAAYFVWSPDGRQIAFTGYARSGPGPHGALETIPISGGGPTVWRATEGNPQSGKALTPTIPAAWLPDGEGILFWVDYQYSASIEADGLPLYLVRSPTSPAHELGFTLVNSASIATSPTGALAITDGGDRYQWTTKMVERCSPTTATCTKIEIPRGDLSLDPSWSPSGHQLLFAVGPNNGETSFPQSALTKWYAKLSLWSVPAGGTTATKVRGTAGGTVSSWSPNGQSMLFESGDALWLRPSPSGTPVRIASPLFPRTAWANYYAEIDWNDQFAWSPAPSH